jgi:pyrroloquinoline quinone biosynthesis protein B
VKLYCYLLAGLLCLLVGCKPPETPKQTISSPALIILGVAQDAGYPQMGCDKDCCKRAWNSPSLKRLATSLALVDPPTKKWWLFEATPDIKEQLQLFRNLTDSIYNFLPDGIFITHGHIGHYTGLMQLGREAMNSNHVSVYVMPRMKKYLSENGPWSQLVFLNNISLADLNNDSSVALNKEITVIPFTAPHRDEFSETAGFRIRVSNYQALFIPDIDKWNKFDRDISAMIRQSNLALLDGTFYKDGELPGRPMSEIPHPFIEESMTLFSSFKADDKKKIRFIHFNHTNPLLNQRSNESIKVLSKGFMIAEQGKFIVTK